MRMLEILSAIGLAFAAAACRPATPSSSPVTPAAECIGGPARGVLPDWARSGFTNPEAVMPYKMATSGDIVAIVFGDPLSAPPIPEHSNKILWVSRHRSATAGLTISAQRMDGTNLVGSPVDVRLDHFPGPSTVDLPAAGCWRLTLQGADWTDSLDLAYVAPRPT